MLKKVKTGIEGLDNMLFGGLPAGTASIIEGGPGAGKTTIGMQFLVEGAMKYNEAGIYISFEQFPEQIYSEMSQLGWNVKELEQKNMMRVLCMDPQILLEHMIQPNGVFEQLVKEISCKRLVIDSISLFRLLGDENQVRTYIYTIRNITRKFFITSLFISQTTGTETSFENYVCDGIIYLSSADYQSNKRTRIIEIIKMRGTPIVEGKHIYRILNDGVHILPSSLMFEQGAVHQEDHPV